MTGEDEYAVVECDDSFDPCCDPKYQDLCEDEHYGEIYEECETNDQGEEVCKCYYDEFCEEE